MPGMKLLSAAEMGIFNTLCQPSGSIEIQQVFP